MWRDYRIISLEIALVSKPVLFSNVCCSRSHCFEKWTTFVQRASRTLHTEQRSGPTILGWNVFVSTLRSKMGFVKEKGETLLAFRTEHNVLDQDSSRNRSACGIFSVSHHRGWLPALLPLQQDVSADQDSQDSMNCFCSTVFFLGIRLGSILAFLLDLG